MVDAALFAIKELMAAHPECLLYGQDVGRRLGGVFREAATLAQTYGDNRVFNTPIQEAFIIGSTVGMSAVGLKPIVEVQFADYIWPGLNQLFTEVSRSNYLSNGKWPVSCIIRVPITRLRKWRPLPLIFCRNCFNTNQRNKDCIPIYRCRFKRINEIRLLRSLILLLFLNTKDYIGVKLKARKKQKQLNLMKIM